MNQTRSYMVIVFLGLFITGCGKADPDKEKLIKTTEWLQERNKVLSDQVTELNAQVKVLKAENPAIKEHMEAQIKKVQEDLAKQHESQMAQVRQLNEEKVKKLEGDKADLQISLGKVTKERLALQELADAGKLLPDAERARFGLERTIWAMLLVAALGVLMFVTSRYHKLRGQLYQSVVRRASQLQEIEVR